MDLHARLQRLMAEGNLTVADLAKWLGRPYATVHSWVVAKRNVRGGTLDRHLIDARLGLAEKLLRKQEGLPVPPLNLQGRIAYVEKLICKARARGLQS